MSSESLPGNQDGKLLPSQNAYESFWEKKTVNEKEKTNTFVLFVEVYIKLVADVKEIGLIWLHQTVEVFDKNTSRLT